MSTEIKLTPEQRLAAYEWAIKGLQSGAPPAVCLLLRRWMHENVPEFDMDLHTAIDFFPEFLKQKPRYKNMHEGWWPGHIIYRAVRIAALENAIKLLNLPE